MRAKSGTALLLAFGLLGSPIWATATRAAGESPAIDAAARARAAKRFKAGEAAFARHEYAAAASAFEEAYQIAPHPAALFNAAQAHEKAGDLTAAANLHARYLRDAPSDDKRRAKANKLLADLVPKIGRIEVAAPDGTDLGIDGQTVELDVTYVDAGDHVVTATFDGKVVERRVNVVAGSLERVLLEAPKAHAATAVHDPDTDTPTRDARQDQTQAQHGLPPGVFYAGVAASVVLGGVTVWSGLDTSSARSDYDQHPTQAGLDDGLAKQHRTNILLGATAVVGVATVAVGLFATNWKHAPPADQARVDLRVGPGVVQVDGRF